MTTVSQELPKDRVSMSYQLFGSHTCYSAPIGHTHCTEAVVGHSCNFSCTPGPMVVTILRIRVGHRIWVIGVEVIATLWALKH